MLWCIAAYVLLFIVAVGTYAVIRKILRKERPPMQFKLLREPGETLRKRLNAADENDLVVLLIVALTPLLLSTGFVTICVKISPQKAQLAVLIAAGVLFLGALPLSGIYAVRRLHRYANDWLGYMGERAVSEALIPLYAEGYRVFHDVPAAGAKKTFNLDHVVIGPSGVWLIETKTRRKRRGRAGYKEHEVAFDGAQLIWPWGEERQAVIQVQCEARWLAEWINRATGIAVVVNPILALPGWFVHEKSVNVVRALNHKNLSSAITGRRKIAISNADADLIARLLDETCRDVAV